MRKSGFLLALLATVLTACGGSGDGKDDAFRPPANGGNGTAATVSSVTVLTDTPVIPSDGLTPANISVLVRNASNQFMANVPVAISADGDAGLAIVSAVTDDNGVAKATLSTAGNPTSRPITVTGNAGGISATTTVNVAGSTIDIQGPESLVTGTTGNYTIVLTDSANNPVRGRQVALSTQPASTLSTANVTTDSNGRATFTMTPTGNASVTITAKGIGETRTKQVTVSGDSFSFTSPAPGTQYSLNDSVTFTVNWLSGGVPVNSGTVNFSTTRGTLTTPAQVTPVGGNASVTLTSFIAGETVVTAVNSSGGSTQNRIVFIASTPSTINVQANPFTVGINQSSTITAVVRDPNNNLVVGKVVEFELTDTTGGTLSLGSAVTDSQGRARTVYTASSTTSATNGVRITARVQGAAVTDYVDLTVAGAPLFLVFGTGNTIEEINNDTQYRLNYTVQVTDANGAGVSGVPVTVSALSWNYAKGKRVAGATAWGTQRNAVCISEDRVTGNPSYDFNGILDPGENQNGLNPISGAVTLEPGNVATVSPGNGTTDANGFLPFTVVYPQDHAGYVQIVLRARTAVQGTAFSKDTLAFWLPGSAADFNNLQSAPPGIESPYGVGASCSDFD
ncbi:MAG: Ig-like domain-containing protein [Steroidobacteraceae bacterium]